MKMTLAQIILYTIIGTPQERCDLILKAKTFTKKHIVDDDPYDEMTQKYLEEKRKNENKRNE